MFTLTVLLALKPYYSFCHFVTPSSERKAIMAPSLREDSPTVWGKCHEVTKRDGRVTLSVRTEGVSAARLAPPSGVNLTFNFLLNTQNRPLIGLKANNSLVKRILFVRYNTVV